MKKYKNYIIALCVILALCVTVCFIPIGASKFIPVLESQVQKELGVKIHAEKLILRIGPSLKLKTPVMHIMYEDGQKFGQFDNVRIVIPWSALFKNDVKVKKIYANNLILRVNSDDKYLNALVKNLENKDFEETPSLALEKYSFSFKDNSINTIYKIAGNNLELAKLLNVKNFRLKSIGSLYINDKQYLSYDISLNPQIDMPEKSFTKTDFSRFAEQLENLDFHSDIIADLKLYKENDDVVKMSGLVNLDNISVLDKDKRSPKSFIYLTFFGNKTGILSNIYTSSDKKIYLDGVINNSKKPEIDLKVKTDEINLADLYKKIKLLADCSRYKVLDSVTGTMKADFVLKGDLNKIKSSGFMKIFDSSISASGLSINKINADVDFSNNIISFTNAVGYVNDAPIMLKGKIDKNFDLELLMNKVELERMLPKQFGIKRGVLSVAAKINGTADNISHKENIQIENFSASKENNNISFTSFKLDTNKDNYAFINNLIITPKKTEFIKLPQVKVIVNEDSLKIPDTNIFMPNSKMKLKGEILDYNNKNCSFSVIADGFINTRDIKALNSQSVIYPFKFMANGDKNLQNIESSVLLEKASLFDEPCVLNFESKINDNNMKIEDLSISPLNGKFPDKIKPASKNSKKLIITGVIENLKNKPTFKNIRVYIPQLFNVTLFDTVAQLKGDIFINGEAAKPDITGQLTVQNLINQFRQLSVNNMIIDFNKNTGVLNAPMVKVADSALGVNMVFSTDISKEILIKNLSVKSKYTNTDTFLMYKDDILDDIPIKVEDGKFYSEKALFTIYNSPLYMSALSADFKLNNNVLYIRNMSSELFNGKVSASADFNMRDESFITKLQARSVSAAPIFDIIAMNKGTVSGSMDFDTNLRGNISSKQSLDGNIKFIVHNGHMGTLGKLEHLLYAQNVVADNMLRTSLSVVTKAITLKDTGLFKYLRGDIDLVDGVANIKFLQSQGPLMSLFIKGQYYPLTDYAKLTVLGRLSDEIVSGLGAFGEFSMNKLLIMLTGEEQNSNISVQDLDMLPQLPMKNTKEFKSVINGILEKPASVIQFNWISYTKKSLKQTEVPATPVKLPEFIDALPY